MEKKREQWKSRIGFIWAAVGSAVGLGSIWRFPYVVGENGGATFIFLYLICLFLIGFPVLISELLIGRHTQLNPTGAYKKLGRTKTWKGVGTVTVVTGFLVSTFYGVIAGWTFGYLIEAIFGGLTHFESAAAVKAHFLKVSASPFWSLGSLFGFMVCAGLFLYTGVRKGIERGNKILMPLLFIMLLGLAIKGLTMPRSSEGIRFLFLPDWSLISPKSVLMALGQAFFALSLGQGTMVTYGSYLTEKENLPSTCIPITIFGTCVSLLAGVAIFSIVFSFGMAPSSGMSLMFETLPIIFSQMSGGYFLALIFFLLLFLAGLTSQISALEPLIAYLIDQKKWKRHRAVFVTLCSSFLIAIICALSFGPLKSFPIFDIIEFLCVNILIPLGGLAAVIMIGWRWGLKNAFRDLAEGTGNLFERYPIIRSYLGFMIKYLAPLIILVVLLDALGVFR